MARDRQRAKQRQAERRQARAAARREGGSPDELDEKAGPLSGMSGAPPENTGRSDTVSESPPPPPLLGREDHLNEEDDELDDVDPELEADALEAGPLATADGEIYEDELEAVDGDGDGATPGPRGVRGGRGDGGQPAQQGGGSKVLNFLKACWAELQRVQWPDRRTLTQLTGIVLFFCILAGTYLGILDAIFSEVIQAIL